MVRLGMIALVCGATLAGPLQAETKQEKAARCAAQSDIVDALTEERRAGKREKRAIRTVSKARDASEAQAITVLAGWVYTLPDAQLAEDVKGAFNTACLGYKP